MSIFGKLDWWDLEWCPTAIARNSKREIYRHAKIGGVGAS